MMRGLVLMLVLGVAWRCAAADEGEEEEEKQTKIKLTIKELCSYVEDYQLEVVDTYCELKLQAGLVADTAECMTKLIPRIVTFYGDCDALRGGNRTSNAQPHQSFVTQPSSDAAD